MKKELIGIFVCLLFVVGSVLTVTGYAYTDKTPLSLISANILYVGGDGPGNYSKIQDAIDNATKGDTVFVYDDSSPYYENVVVDKSINLIGEDRKTTVIDSSGRGYVVSIPFNSDWVNFRGFTIKNGDIGIHIKSNSNTITDNTISNNRVCGISLSSSSTNIISDNSFFNDGIYVYDSYHNNLENNTVNGKPLVYLEDESNKVINYEVGQVILVNCNKITVENQIFSNIFVGITLGNTDNSIIRNNDCSNNRYGILLWDSSGNTITGNTISDNDWLGIVLFESNSNSIIGNTISLNYGDGLYLWLSNLNTITGNTISNNGGGIYLWHSNLTTVEGNTISSNRANGVYLFYSYSNIILKNNFLDNYRDAFFKYEGWKYFLIKRNQWQQNYWNRPRILPKLINGQLHKPTIPPNDFYWNVFKLDWRPAFEKYDIENLNLLE